jgi:hypothetical protein
MSEGLNDRIYKKVKVLALSTKKSKFVSPEELKFMFELKDLFFHHFKHFHKLLLLKLNMQKVNQQLLITNISKHFFF